MKSKMFILLASIIAFFLIVSLWGFYISIRPPKIISRITPETLALDYENIEFSTQDNLTLRGWFIPRQSSGQVPRQNGDKKTIILLHGYPADKGDILPALAFLNKKYNLLLFDFRYLGESEGAYSTAGAREIKDLLGAIHFLKSRGIEEVGVWGFSLGGAVALMTAPQAPEIKVIVSESSYAHLNLMAPQLYQIPILKYPLGFLTGLWGNIILGIDIKNVSPAKSAESLNIPILIVHSKNDHIIPFRHALLLQEALKHNPQAEFWFGEDLIHGQFGRIYETRIGDFFEKNL